MSLSTILEPMIPLIMGAVGVLLMFPVTILCYRRFLAPYFAQKTKTTFVDACDDEDFVNPMKETLLWRELAGENAGIIQLATARIDNVPSSMGEVVRKDLDTAVKTLGNHFSQEFTNAVNHLQTHIDNAIASAVKARRFGGDPAAAQEKGVESRKVNQIVDALDNSINPQFLEPKVRELADFLTSIEQPELADWLEENPGKITQVERRIRANPVLAQRIAAFQQRVGAGKGVRTCGGGAIDL